MTLNEAIKHCEEVTEEQEKAAKEWHENQVRKCELIRFAEMDYTHENECKECAEEHRQLAEWLRELKELKEHSASFQKINELAKFAIDATGQSDGYSQGMCNGIEYMRGILTNTDCKFFDSEVTE